MKIILLIIASSLLSACCIAPRDNIRIDLICKHTDPANPLKMHCSKKEFVSFQYKF